MDVTKDFVPSETARELADAVGALSRSLKGKLPCVPRDVLELQSNLLTHWIKINRPDLFPKYYDDLCWIAREAKRLCRQRSSESPSDRWMIEYLPFSKRCFYFRNFLGLLAAHPDGQRSDRVADTLTEDVTKSEQPASKGMSWKKAKDAAERHVKRNNNAFPGVNALARIVGCVPSTMLKAIKNSVYLAARKAEHEVKKPKEVALTGDVLEITPQQRETDPCDVELARLTKEQADDLAREERQHIKRQHTSTPHR